MAGVDPDLHRLLTESADRTVDAVTAYGAEVAQVRREIADDRRADAKRFERLDERLDALDRKVACLVRGDADDPDAELRPRPTGLDVKTLVSIAGVIVVPIVVAIISTGG